MTGFKLDGLFFDSRPVIDAMDRKERASLSRIGAFIRTAARSLMRRRKRYSRPGEPPSVHEGSLKNKLFFSYDPRTKSVVVGPAKYKQGDIPRLLEEGGDESVVHKGVMERIHIEPRPFMQPALKQEMPN